MTNTTTRVFIDLVYQGRNGTFAITLNMPRTTLRNRDELIVDHQHSMVKALDETFDEHVPAGSTFQGLGEGGCHPLSKYNIFTMK